MLSLALVAVAALAGDVIQLTPDNFDEVVNKEGTTLTLIKYYAPWCGHCKAMAADYEKAATELKGIDDKIQLAELNADEHGDFARKKDIEGFPTLKVHRPGAGETMYNGPRSADGIVKALVKLAKPVLMSVDSQSELDEKVKAALAEGESVITASFPKDSPKKSPFKSFAEANSKDLTFFVYEGADDVEISLHRPEEAAVKYTDSKVTIKKLQEWYNPLRFPVFGAITQDNYREYMERELPLFWAFVDTAAVKDLAKVVAPVARKFAGKVAFVHLSGAEHGQMAPSFGLSAEGPWPQIAIDIAKKKRHYAYPKGGEVPSEADLEKWVEDVLEGNVAATVRSQAEPESQPGEDGVFVLTGNTLGPQGVKSGKNVMIEFYAPWCGHCKQLAPEYSALAKAFADNDKVRIAKMDGTENDIVIDAFEVSGYPTLYFVKADGTIQRYEGGRTKADLEKYINANGIF